MSMTQTRQPPVQPTRTHDYLYDPVHTLSSQRDHGRATFKAQTSSDRVRRVPVFNTMFSALRHHPRFQMRLETTDPVPRFISRQWRGYNQQARESLIRYKTFNYAPDIKVPGVAHQDAQVGGTNRYKYFRRPIIPFLQQVPPEVVLQQSKMDPLGQPDQVMTERAPTPPFRSVEIQTDYRENETQTDPYTPEYVVRPGSQPELLTLATLSYGRGLPAGLAEVEMIERARAKRAWEATLPPLNDVSQLEKRKRMMDEMERKEWKLREEEIEKLQEARLELLTKILQEREENHEELNAKRLDKLWSKKQKERERKAAWIRKEHIKAIRKLTEKRRRVEGKLERRDITEDYSKHDSETYAPRTRHGVFLDKGSEQFVVKSKYLSTYQGLLELENSLPDFVTQPRVKAPKPKAVSKMGFVKRKEKRVQELDEVYKDIKSAKTRGEAAPKPLRFLQKIEKPVPRPPTPSVEVPDDYEEERELAIIFLQQVIRGRAIQNMMFEGKEKRQELINELRSTHALQTAEQQMKKQEKQATLNLQRQKKMHDNKESFIDEALSQNEGAAVGDMVDFLSKELVRLQEERRIHAFAMLAERKRRIQEAEESGRRQVEERRRREEDEIFKQVIKVHQNTVDTYLEDIILGSLDRTADNQAREEIQVKAEQINDVAYQMEHKKTKLQSEEIVAELVSSFLLPEVQKLTMREKVKNSQRKHLVAAHKIIHTDTESVMTAHPVPNAGAGGKRPRSKAGERVASAEKGRRSTTPTGGKSSRQGSASKRTSTPTKASSPATSRPTSGGKRDAPTPARVASPKARPGSGGGSRKGSAASDKSAKTATSKIPPTTTQSPTSIMQPTNTDKDQAPTPSDQPQQQPLSDDKVPETQQVSNETAPSTVPETQQVSNATDPSTAPDADKAPSPVFESQPQIAEGQPDVSATSQPEPAAPVESDKPASPAMAESETVVVAEPQAATSPAPAENAGDEAVTKTDAPTGDAPEVQTDAPTGDAPEVQTDAPSGDVEVDQVKGQEAGDEATAPQQEVAPPSSGVPSGKATADSGTQGDPL